ncbi:MAG: hypothetical protein LC687_00025 [Actinobacteria bacterium]|nr:hypothetical protein [Actinomycetota bacterium]
MAATLLNTAQVAEKLATTPRTLRKFLRSPEGLDSKVGKGHRWSIEAKQVQSLKSRFAKWEAAQAAAREAREAAAEAEAETDEVETTDEA